MSKIEVRNRISTGDIEIDCFETEQTIKLTPRNAQELIIALSKAMLDRGNKKRPNDR